MARRYSRSAPSQSHSYASAEASTARASPRPGSSSRALSAAAFISTSPGPGSDVAVDESRTVGRRQTFIRGGEARILGDGGLEVCDRFLERLRRALPPVVAAEQVGIVRVRIHRPRARRPPGAVGRDGDADLLGDRARHLVLEREHVLQAALVAVRPEVAVGRSVDELRRDAHAPGRSHHRAFHDTFHAQLARDLGQRLGAALVAHHRLPRDHTQRRPGGEVGDERVRHAVAEVVLRGISGQVGQGEDRQRPDGDPAGERGTALERGRDSDP